MDEPDPLTRLLEHLVRGEEVPLAWVVAYAPDGDLRSVWQSSVAPEAVLRVGCAVAPPEDLARAAAAVARVAVRECIGDDEERQRALLLLAAVDAHSRGRPFTADDELRWQALSPSGAISSPRAAACHAACSAADALEPSSVAESASKALSSASFALRCAAGGSANEHDPAINVRLATALSAELPCPTLEQLRAAFGR